MTVIDVHAHVSAPREWQFYRSMLLGHRGDHGRGSVGVNDEQIERALAHHLQRIDDVGTDFQLISPRPNLLMHFATPWKIVRWWIEETNDIIARQVKLHPDRFAAVCGLPQAPGVSPQNCIEELERCMEMGFVGCLINPDPGEMGGDETPALGDEFWYPLYEKLVQYDIPAMVHSASCQRLRETYSLHFISEETIAIYSLVKSRVFEDFPNLKIIIPHGGGAVPYQIGRWMAGPYKGRGEYFEESIRKLYYDTALYTKDSIELLIKTVGPERCLFATENPGTGSVKIPWEDRELDDTKPLIEGIEWLSDEGKKQILEDNARRLFKLPVAVAAA